MISKHSYRQLTLAILILLLATILRFYLLDNQSFWNDEGNTARLSERSMRLIIEGTASDIHPPLYYLILRGWRELIGESEFALRAFSAFVGVLTVAATVRLGRWLDSTTDGRNGWGIAYVAGMLTAVSPALIYYSQEARMYSLLGFLATFSTLLLFKLQKNQHWPLVLGYAAALTAGLYTHYFFPAIMISHFLMWLISQLPALYRHKQPLAPLRQPVTIRYAMANAVALLLYAPWFPIFLRSTGGGAGSTLDAAFTWQAVTWLLTGPVIHTATALIIGAIFLTSAVRRIRFRWPLGRFHLYIWVIVSLLMMNLVGSTEPQHLKFLTTAVPPLMLLIAMRTVGLWELRAPSRENDRFLHNFGRVIGACLAGPALIGMGLVLNQLYYNPIYFRADYRAMAAQIEAANNPNAGIILNAPNQWEVFTYYYDGSAEVYPFPKVNSTAAEITPQLEEIAAKHERLYLILWGGQGFDPERQVEHWLDAHAFKAQDEWRGDVRFVSYAIPVAAATEMETAVELPVGEAITLEGYTLIDDTLTAGDIVQVTLFWEAQQSIEQRYKVFLHLVAFDGSLVAQRDSEPVGNLRPTNTWAVGETIIDNHGVLLPADLPAGAYALNIGLYDIADPNNRLLFHTAEGVVDSWRLAIIVVEK